MVMLSAAKHLSCWVQRCFAALSMTGLDLSLEQERSSSLEPCLKIMDKVQILSRKELQKGQFSGAFGKFVDENHGRYIGAVNDTSEPTVSHGMSECTI